MLLCLDTLVCYGDFRGRDRLTEQLKRHGGGIITCRGSTGESRIRVSIERRMHLLLRDDNQWRNTERAK